MENTSLPDRIGVARPADGEGLTIADTAERNRLIAGVDRDVLKTLQKSGGLSLLLIALQEEWHPKAVKNVVSSIMDTLFPVRDCRRNQDPGPAKREPSVYGSSFGVYRDDQEEVVQVADVGAALAALAERREVG
jgi:hypothetical protein